VLQPLPTRPGSCLVGLSEILPDCVEVRVNCRAVTLPARIPCTMYQPFHPLAPTQWTGCSHPCAAEDPLFSRLPPWMDMADNGTLIDSVLMLMCYTNLVH
jgi:hypothetical protein